MIGHSTLLISLAAVPLIAVAFIGKKEPLPEGLRLPPEVTHAVYMGYALSQDELDLLTANFASLEATKRVMRERADAHLLCHIPGQSAPRAFAVFLYEGLVFEGYDSDSWLVHGKGGRAVVHQMNEETKELLKRYAKEADAQAIRRRNGGRI